MFFFIKTCRFELKIPTEKGLSLGITNEERIIRDEPARINLFNRGHNSLYFKI